MAYKEIHFTDQKQAHDYMAGIMNQTITPTDWTFDPCDIGVIRHGFGKLAYGVGNDRHMSFYTQRKMHQINFWPNGGCGILIALTFDRMGGFGSKFADSVMSQG